MSELSRKPEGWSDEKWDKLRFDMSVALFGFDEDTVRDDERRRLREAMRRPDVIAGVAEVIGKTAIFHADDDHEQHWIKSTRLASRVIEAMLQASGVEAEGE